MEAAGFVLTGGESRRMGRDKALLPLGDANLLHSIATTVSTVLPSVTLVGKPGRYSHLPWPAIDDRHPGLGPLGGLESALAFTAAPLNLVVSCDLPGLTADWLRTLLARAAGSESLCVATGDPDGRVHPLCAVYRAECLGTVQQAIREGQLRMTLLLQSLGAEILHSSTKLHNVNTPTDWDSWLLTSVPPHTDRSQ